MRSLVEWRLRAAGSRGCRGPPSLLGLPSPPTLRFQSRFERTPPITRPRPLNRDDAKQSPETTFASHIDIVGEPLLTRGEQLKASGEGMRTQCYSAEQVKTLELIEQAKELLV